MKIHLAGVPGGGTTGDCKRERELNSLFVQRLWTYYWLIKDKGNMKKDKTVELFLDSGAFSAKYQNVKIDIHKYIAFIQENQNIIDVYANLDEIGSAKKTFENQKIMEKEGLTPLPVYHLEDPIDYLHYYVNNYNYICIGGMARGATANIRTEFLDECFKIVCDTPDKLHKCKVHGFGLTSLALMLRYPWYSVDSTSWVVTGRMGSIYIPRREHGRWIYDKNSWKIAISSRSPSKEDKNRHFQTLSKQHQKLVLQYLDEKGYKIGKSEFKKEKQSYKLKENERWAEKKPVKEDGSPDKNALRKVEIIIEDGLCNRYQLRDELNIIYFLDLEKTMRKWPWPYKLKSGEEQKNLGL